MVRDESPTLHTPPVTEKPAAAVAPTGVTPGVAGLTPDGAGAVSTAGAAATAAGSRVPSCLPPDTKPIIATAAGGAPEGGTALAAAGGDGATPVKVSLAACGRTPGTNGGADISGAASARSSARRCRRSALSRGGGTSSGQTTPEINAEL